MTTTATRSLSIAYGTVTCGGSASPYHIDGGYVWNITPFEASVTWDVIVYGASSAADLESSCKTLEAEFAKRFLRLRVLTESSEVIDWDPSGSSGFLAEPSIRLIPDHPLNTARSRAYRCTVSAQLPANDNTGRRNASIELAIDTGGVFTVTIRGTYTAQAGTGAKANYDAKIGTFATAILSGFGGSYNLQQETTTEDDQAGLCEFVRVYRQIIFNETAAGNIAGILAHTVSFDMEQDGPGDTPGGPYGDAVRVQVVRASYAAGVDRRVTTDLQGLWENTLRAYVLSQAESRYAGTVAAVSESPSFDVTNNQITCSVMLHVVTGAVIEYRVTQRIDAPSGKVIVPLWAGNEHVARVYQGKTRTTRTTSVRVRTTDSIDAVQRAVGQAWVEGSVDADGRYDFPDQGGDRGAMWVNMGLVRITDPDLVGIVRLGRTYHAWEFSYEYVEQWVEPPPAVTVSAGSQAPASIAPVTPGGVVTPR